MTFLRFVFPLLILPLVFTTMASAQTAPARDRQALTKKVDALFAQFDKPGSPGCALAIIEGNQIIYKRGYGAANLDYDVPLTPSSVFYIASTSKQFTAASTLLLARQGKISLDDPVKKYFPELSAAYDPVTVRQLVHHTSGIRDYLTLMTMAGLATENIYTEDDVLELIARQKELNHPPGEQYAYTNSGYILQALLVKRVTGKPLREFADENIFKPLGMINTRFRDDRTIVVRNRAVGYTPKQTGGFSVVTTNFQLVGDGGLLSTVEDLALWDANFYRNRIGGDETDATAFVEQLLTPGTLKDSKKIDYAFGLFVEEYKGLKTVGHGGAFYGFRADMLRFPEQRFSSICLCNTENVSASRLNKQIADIYLADKLKPEQPSATTGTSTAAATTFINLPEADLRDKAGTYRSAAGGGIWKLSVKDGKLMAEVSGFNFQLAPLTVTHFRGVGSPVKVDVHFRLSAAGAPRVVTAEIENQPSAVLTPVESVTLSAAQLTEYVGDYHSDELQATYKLAVENGRLVFKHKNAPRFPLTPTVRDGFDLVLATIQFTRDKENRITGFDITAPRVTKISFVKR